MELRLQLLVMVLQDVHAPLQAALVLPQKLRLGQEVGLVGMSRRHRAIRLPRASGGAPSLLLFQLLVLPLEVPGIQTVLSERRFRKRRPTGGGGR